MHPQATIVLTRKGTNMDYRLTDEQELLIDSIKEFCERYTSEEQIREMYENLKMGGFARIRILPSVSQIVEGKAHFVQTREIDPLDILGRTPIIIPPVNSAIGLRKLSNIQVNVGAHASITAPIKFKAPAIA